jgi:hypothetical protein
VVRGGGATRAAAPHGIPFVAKVLLVFLLCFVAIGFVRIGLNTASYAMASQSADMRVEINDMKSAGESLAIQGSLLTSPSHLRDQARGSLGMHAPEYTGTLTLPKDIVQTNSAGDLSLSSSLAVVAAQE